MTDHETSTAIHELHAGTTSDVQDNPHDCTPCEPGTFSAVQGSSDCSLCPAGLTGTIDAVPRADEDRITTGRTNLL